MGIAVEIKRVMGTFTLDVSWDAGNELAVLFGYSGSGKSLTLRAIAGLMKPDSGTITLSGTKLYDRDRNLPPQERSVGFVFQDLALFPHMTVEENILYGGHGVEAKERRERCSRLVSRFRLSGLERRRPGDISGGQRQRVAFARALMRRPGALLLDEPFSSLDAPLRAEMRELLRDVQRELMIPVVLVTHDREEALGLADRLIIYAGGRVEQTGTPREVLTMPKTELVEQLLVYDRELLPSRLFTTKGSNYRVRDPLWAGLPMVSSR
ncbi:MAG: ABC transporter ATP-binding protein [Nitrospirae bacterium]|nr:ABC transporter ATP-binding protein [Nitrospirota bacterium]